MRVYYIAISALALAACAPTAAQTPVRAPGPMVADTLVMHGWDAECVPTSDWEQYNCTMTRAVPGVGPFRLLLSAERVDLFLPDCRQNGRWNEERFQRRGSINEQIQHVMRRIRETVRACDEVQLLQIEETTSVLSLLMRATK
jgi:hypothetical protein